MNDIQVKGIKVHDFAYSSAVSPSATRLSTSSALFDRRPNQDQAGTNVFSDQLKKLYRQITNLETQVKQEDSMDDADDIMGSRIEGQGG